MFRVSLQMTANATAKHRLTMSSHATTSVTSCYLLMQEYFPSMEDPKWPKTLLLMLRGDRLGDLFGDRLGDWLASGL